MLRNLMSAVMIVGGTLVCHPQSHYFNRRYDAFGQGLEQVAWSVERNGQGYMVFHNSEFIQDTLYYGGVATTLRLDSAGNMLNEDHLLIPLNNSPVGWSGCSDPLPNGGYAVAGGLQPAGDTIAYVLLLMVDSTGTVTSQTTYGTINESRLGRDLKRTVDGGFGIVGEFAVGNTTDAFLIKTDSAGNEQWTQTYGVPNRFDYLTSIVRCPSGGYNLSGARETTPNSGLYDELLLRVDGGGGAGVVAHLWHTLQ